MGRDERGFLEEFDQGFENALRRSQGERPVAAPIYSAPPVPRDPEQRQLKGVFDALRRQRTSVGRDTEAVPIPEPRPSRPGQGNVKPLRQPDGSIDPFMDPGERPFENFRRKQVLAEGVQVAGAVDMRTQNGVKFIKGLMERGVPRHVAVALAGNVEQESLFDPNAVGDNGNALGMFQHNGERRKALEQYAKRRGTEPTDFDTQLDFAVTELNTTHRGAARLAVSAPDVPSATKALSQKFFVPGKPHNARRIKAAEQFDLSIPSTDETGRPPVQGGEVGPPIPDGTTPIEQTKGARAKASEAAVAAVKAFFKGGGNIGGAIQAAKGAIQGAQGAKAAQSAATAAQAVKSGKSAVDQLFAILAQDPQEVKGQLPTQQTPDGPGAPQIPGVQSSAQQFELAREQKKADRMEQIRTTASQIASQDVSAAEAPPLQNIPEAGVVARGRNVLQEQGGSPAIRVKRRAAPSLQLSESGRMAMQRFNQGDVGALRRVPRKDFLTMLVKLGRRDDS